MPDPKPTPGGGRVFLGAYKPPKPIGEMTEAELDAWASAIGDAITACLLRPSADGRGGQARRAARREGMG